MANFCSECGAALAGARLFCSECGHQVGEVEPTASTDGIDDGREIETMLDDSREAEGADEDGVSDPCAATFGIALAATTASGGNVFETMNRFDRWQEQPRVPSLQTDLWQFFVPTGRDTGMASQLEALLARNGLVMGPAGRNAVPDRSQWDYFNGFWLLDAGDGFPIDAWFGRSALTGNSSVALVCDVLMASSPSGPNTDGDWLSGAAETMWTHASCFA